MKRFIKKLGRGKAQHSNSLSVKSSREEDHLLMLKTQNDDQKAFKKLFEKYKGPIMSYVYSLIGDPLAEEITQEVFLRVYRYRKTYTPKARFTTWLWTIARNVSIDFLRSSARNELVHSTDENPIFDQLESPISNAETQMIENSEIEKINKCIDRLPDSQKDLLLLQINSDVTYEEMSDLTNTTVSAVKSLLFRARTSLLKCLEDCREE